jgi:uncharacterized damage-inducible protein DinB
MNHQMKALRYWMSTLAITCALSLVGFAQTTAPTATAMAAKSQAPDHIAMMVADWTRARDYTKEYLDAMPEDGFGFKPSADIRSFAEQFLHLANANYAFASAATGVASTNKVNLEKAADMQSKAACTKAVMDSYDFVIKAIQGANAKALGESVKVFGRDTTRGGALAKAFEHQTHHRGQTTIYIRLKGVKPPPEKLF